jgi:hypothetical protein
MEANDHLYVLVDSRKDNTDSVARADVVEASMPYRLSGRCGAQSNYTNLEAAGTDQRNQRIVEQGHPVIIEALKQKREVVAVVIATGVQDAVCVVAIASFIAVPAKAKPCARKHRRPSPRVGVSKGGIIST